jgi:hypothetical protein
LPRLIEPDNLNVIHEVARIVYETADRLNFKQLKAAYDLAEQFVDVDGSPRTVWGYVNGLTRLSQQTTYTDDRTFLDRAGSSVLALAV